jgi:hypothetical protein
MSYSPPDTNWHTHEYGTHQEYPHDLRCLCGGIAAASAAWPTANVALYLPVYIRAPVVVKQIWWENGSTVTGSTSADMAIYNEAGERLVETGVVTQATVDVPQVTNITDLPLAPGRYWLGLVLSNNTSTIRRWTLATDVGNVNKWFNIGQETVTAAQLPTTMTPVACTSVYIPLMGLDFIGIAM